jgi:hypothetical protein
MIEHHIHVSNIADIPSRDIPIKGCTTEHDSHVSNIADIPSRDIPVKSGTTKHSIHVSNTRESHVQENPLTDPPIEETAKGYDSFKWYLRQRYMIEDRGAPPVMQCHPLSIMHEVLVLEPEFNERVNQAIAFAKDNNNCLSD